MVNSWWISLTVGTLLGFLTGLGIGGGSLLILWLTLVLGWQQISAQGINLLFFLPASVISSILRYKSGKLPLKKLFPAMAAGCFSAAVCSWGSGYLNLELLKKLFGLLLLITGAREILYRDKKKEPM